MNMATGEIFDDGSYILYINGAYRGDDEIGNPMHDFSCSDPDDMINKELADRTRYFKETEDVVEAVCKVMEDMREDAIEKDKIERVKKLLKLRKLTLEEIADTMEMNIDKVREISMMKPI